MFQFNNNKKGFTLIVVMAIIAVLVLLSGLNVAGNINEAKKQEL